MRSQLTICRRLPSLLFMMILLNHEAILIFFYLMETNFARTAKRGGEDEAIARNVLGLCHLSADQLNFAVSNAATASFSRPLATPSIVMAIDFFHAPAIKSELTAIASDT